jgi:hypothetical protein
MIDQKDSRRTNQGAKRQSWNARKVTHKTMLFNIRWDTAALIVVQSNHDRRYSLAVLAKRTKKRKRILVFVLCTKACGLGYACMVVARAATGGNGQRDPDR